MPPALAHVGQRHPGPRVERMVDAAHVEHLDRRQRPPIDPLAQPQAPERDDALGPRGRAPREHDRAVLLGPADRDRPGVVARVPLVLVGRVVLLVDDDQADVGERREHRRSRAHADARLPGPQPEPLVVPLALAEPGMEHRDDVAEPRLEAPDGLGRERDLGDEHDRAAPGGERLLDRPQVHLGLARAGDAVEQEPPPATAASPAAPAPAPSAPRTASSAARCSPVSSGSAVEPPSDRHRGRAARARGRLQSHEPAGLEPPQRRGSERGRDRGSVALERLERDPLAVGQGRAVARAPARRRRSARPPAPACAGPRRRLRAGARA